MKIEITSKGNTHELSVLCPICKQKSTFIVKGTRHFNMLREFLGGKGYAQDLDFLSVDDRELLISGICTPCWDKMSEEEV